MRTRLLGAQTLALARRCSLSNLRGGQRERALRARLQSASPHLAEHDVPRHRCRRERAVLLRQRTHIRQPAPSLRLDVEERSPRAAAFARASLLRRRGRFFAAGRASAASDRVSWAPVPRTPISTRLLRHEVSADVVDGSDVGLDTSRLFEPPYVRVSAFSSSDVGVCNGCDCPQRRQRIARPDELRRWIVGQEAICEAVAQASPRRQNVVGAHRPAQQQEQLVREARVGAHEVVLRGGRRPCCEAEDQAPRACSVCFRAEGPTRRANARRNLSHTLGHQHTAR